MTLTSPVNTLNVLHVTSLSTLGIYMVCPTKQSPAHLPFSHPPCHLILPYLLLFFLFSQVNTIVSRMLTLRSRLMKSKNTGKNVRKSSRGPGLGRRAECLTWCGRMQKDSSPGCGTLFNLSDRWPMSVPVPVPRQMNNKDEEWKEDEEQPPPFVCHCLELTPPPGPLDLNFYETEYGKNLPCFRCLFIIFNNTLRLNHQLGKKKHFQDTPLRMPIII